LSTPLVQLVHPHVGGPDVVRFYLGGVGVQPW